MPDASPRDALAAAARTVTDAWEQYAADATSAAEVEATVIWLVATVHAEAAGTSAGEELVTTPLARRVLAGLRAAWVAGLTPPLEAGAVATVQAMERVAALLAPPWSERFQERLGGPSGLELIVEIAHDLRSPMTSILFLAETMLRGRSGPLTPL